MTTLRAVIIYNITRFFMTEFDKQLELFKADLKKTLEKSQDSFEKQLSYISAGAFGVTMAFIDKIVGKLSLSTGKYLIILGWLFLGCTFIINLISHIVASKYHFKTIEDIDSGKFDSLKATRRIKRINTINFASVVTLMIGILFIIIFIGKNIYMSEENQTNQSGDNKTTEVPVPPAHGSRVIPNLGFNPTTPVPKPTEPPPPTENPPKKD